MLLTTVVGAALSLFAVVHLSSHESGKGAADTPRLPVQHTLQIVCRVVIVFTVVVVAGAATSAATGTAAADFSEISVVVAIEYCDDCHAANTRL